MNVDDVMAAFAFAKDRPLQVTMRDQAGKAWATDAPCSVENPSYAYPEGTNPPTVRIAPHGDSGYYTDFPVEKVSQDPRGRLVLSGPKGTATFQVGGA